MVGQEQQEGLAVASIARDDPSPLPGMHRDHNALPSQTDRWTDRRIAASLYAPYTVGRRGIITRTTCTWLIYENEVYAGPIVMVVCIHRPGLFLCMPLKLLLMQKLCVKYACIYARNSLVRFVVDLL